MLKISNKVLLNSLKDKNFGFLGGGVVQGSSSHYVGPHGS